LYDQAGEILIHLCYLNATKGVRSVDRKGIKAKQLIVTGLQLSLIKVNEKADGPWCFVSNCALSAIYDTCVVLVLLSFLLMLEKNI